MKKVTLWYKVKKDDDGVILNEKFNHLEDGWIEGEFPLPKDESFSNQLAWEKESWRFTHKEMNENYKVLLV